MKNYRETDGCLSCKHSIINNDWDGLLIYCGFDGKQSQESYKKLAYRVVDNDSFWDFVD